MTFGVNDGPARSLRACCCSGPRPGRRLCPCREAAQTEQEVRIALLEDEVRRLRSRVRYQEAINDLIN